MKKKAVALISGGLDSILAAKVVMDQGFDIIGLYCTSAFSKSYGNEQETHAVKVSRALGIDLRIFDMGQEYIELVRRPAHGYGKNTNPCIDCKIFMLKKARAIMDELGAPFVVTGEVLGQRPMSQRRDTLQVIERDADMRGLIMRPLSAKLLPPTKAELAGQIDREKLLSISGRSRNVQLRLAERYGIRGYSAPAGGCLLTDKNFSAKLIDLCYCAPGNVSESGDSKSFSFNAFVYGFQHFFYKIDSAKTGGFGTNKRAAPVNSFAC